MATISDTQHAQTSISAGSAATASQTSTSAIPFPNTPDKTLHISVTELETSYLIFLTSRASSSTGLSSIQSSAPLSYSQGNPQARSSLADTSLLEGGMQPAMPLADSTTALPTQLNGMMGKSPLGSFIYGLPNRFSPSEPLTTPLVSVPSTLDLATRLCRILVLRLAGLGAAKPVCLGCSIEFDGLGDAVTEEVGVVKGIVEEVCRIVSTRREQRADGVKG